MQAVQAVRPSRTHAVLAVAVCCLVASAVFADVTSVGRTALAYAFALGFGAVVLCSRRWPVPALLVTAVGLVVYYALGLPPIGLAAPVAAALYVAAEQGRVRWAAGIAGSLLVVSVVARLAEGDDTALVLGLELGSEAVLMLAVVALGDAVRSRRFLRAEMQRQAAAADDERRREAARQVDAERIRIARDLHDTLGHTMSVIALQAAVAEEAVADGAGDGVRSAVASIRQAAAGAMAELRATLGTLRRGPGSGVEPAPGLDRLGVLVEGVARSGLPVRLQVDGDVGAVPAVVGTTVYRVVQEALTNALRHSGAGGVAVTVHVAGSTVSLEVVDDGHGAPGEAGSAAPGHGLHGMAERVALLGGTVEAGSADGGGFRVRARLPLSGADG